MNLGIMLFTWPPDALIARRTIDGFKKAYPDSKAYVSIEAIHAPEFPCRLFDDCTLLTDGTPGRQNLNGIEHMRYAAKLAQRAVDEGAEVVVKVDSDFVSVLDELVPTHVAGGKGMTGYECSTPGWFRRNYIVGGCYCWSKALVTKLQTALWDETVVDKLYAWQRAEHPQYLPEDMAFQTMADLVGEGHLALPGLSVSYDPQAGRESYAHAYILPGKPSTAHMFRERTKRMPNPLEQELERLREMICLEQRHGLFNPYV